MEKTNTYVLVYKPSKAGIVLDFKKYQLLEIQAKNHSKCNGTGRIGRELKTNTSLLCSCAKLHYLIGEEQLVEIEKYHPKVFKNAIITKVETKIKKAVN
ncbi:MAG: hypothetical protein Q8K02_18210 [Flavobacterium sp.]|nr:hypothetical protein [Flavobacterium sp.]